MTENGCFPHTSDRFQNGVENRAKNCTKTQVGLIDHTETSTERFSGTLENFYCQK